MQAQYAISSMGLPVLLSVLTEDRDDLDLLKGALEVLQLSVALPQEAAAQQSPSGKDVSLLQHTFTANGSQNMAQRITHPYGQQKAFAASACLSRQQHL